MISKETKERVLQALKDQRTGWEMIKAAARAVDHIPEEYQANKNLIAIDKAIKEIKEQETERLYCVSIAGKRSIWTDRAGNAIDYARNASVDNGYAHITSELTGELLFKFVGGVCTYQDAVTTQVIDKYFKEMD